METAILTLALTVIRHIARDRKKVKMFRPLLEKVKGAATAALEGSTAHART